MDNIKKYFIDNELDLETFLLLKAEFDFYIESTEKDDLKKLKSCDNLMNIYLEVDGKNNIFWSDQVHNELCKFACEYLYSTNI